MSQLQNNPNRPLDSDSQGNWIIFSDLSMGGFIIFFILAVIFMVKAIPPKKENPDDEGKLKQDGMYEVFKGFDDEELITVRPDGTIRFSLNEESGNQRLFESGVASPTMTFQEKLTDFIPRFLDSIQSIKSRVKEISEIRIEGHTDNECSDDKTEKECYLYNLRLSQKRANSILELILYGGIIENYDDRFQQFLQQKLTASGYSYSRAINNSNEVVEFADIEAKSNDRLSRRVDFKVILESTSEKDPK